MPSAPDALPFPPYEPYEPYEKIADSLAAWLGDDEPAYRAASRVEWIVTEKIHGANFCLVTNGLTIRAAKRKSFLSDDEDFFGHRTIVERLTPRVLHLHAKARADDPRVAIAYLYGELFGGAYPHPDVPPVPGVAPVQTGAWYAPGIEFCVFDVGVILEGTRERVYLDQTTSERLCDDASILFTRALLRGTYEDTLAFPLGFETTVPAILGLPSLGPTNKAEGVVIKPARSIVVPRRSGWIRPVIKRKIPEFAEDERFHQAQKWPSPQARSSPVSPGALDALRADVSALVNENRLFAAVSKVGQVRPDDAARLAEVLALIKEDLDVELRARAGPRLAALSPAEAEELARFMDGEARALVGFIWARRRVEGFEP